MSKITTIRQAIETVVLAKLPAGYIKLNDPYNVDQNDEGALQKGYGIRREIRENKNRHLCGKAFAQTFVVVLTRAVTNVDFRPDDFEADIDACYEDLELILNEIEASPQLSSPDITYARYISDIPSFVFPGKQDYVKLEATLEIEYQEAV